MLKEGEGDTFKGEEIKEVINDEPKKKKKRITRDCTGNKIVSQLSRKREVY